MIFAAGLGTRLKPLTDRLPKALIPVADIPLLEHIILKLRASGFDEIIINVHHFADMVIDFLEYKKHFGIRIEISDERDVLLDTGGAIKKAGWFFDDGKPFLIHNVDILSNLNLIKLYEHHIHSNPLATLVVSERETSRYLLFDEKQYLHGWINYMTGEIRPDTLSNIKPYHKLAFAGIQVLSPQALELMQSYPDKFPIMDFYLSNAQDQRIEGCIPPDFKMIDVGKIDILDRAESFYQKLR